MAVKSVLKVELSPEDDERLHNELVLLRELKHPGIVRLQSVYNNRRYYHLVMEIMNGGNLLSRMVSSKGLSEASTRNVCRSVLRALVFMHAKKIAHRDINPENILLESDGSDSKVKICDLGSAKLEDEPYSFTTMCGSSPYAAPEITLSQQYGLSCDLWSVGVVALKMMGGDMLFDHHGAKVPSGFSFDECGDISKEAKAFITSLLKQDPENRRSASSSANHLWFKAKRPDIGQKKKSDEPLVFFMVGSQRSGSNWLRSILNEREDLAGPYPPSIMREFSAILKKYGDLSVEHNFKILADHVITYVEDNPVPWTDKHGNKLFFPRVTLFASALESSERILEERSKAGNGEPLSSEMYLLCVFDALMNYYAKVNNKVCCNVFFSERFSLTQISQFVWLSYSLEMNMFHDLLVEFYGLDRLRYIYLVRDPRDVTMSCMKKYVRRSKLWCVRFSMIFSCDTLLAARLITVTATQLLTNGPTSNAVPWKSKSSVPTTS